MKAEKKYLIRYGVVTIAVILMVLFADYLGLFNGVNMYMYDLCFRIRGEKKTSKNIVIAAIDEKSLASLGRWPLRRLHYAILLDRLNEARIVGMDVIMVEPSEDDLVLADAIKRHGRVILPVYIDQRLSLIGPSKEFSPLKTGHAHIEHDIDGIVRRIFHSLYFKDALLPSFASVIYEEATGDIFPRQRVTTGSGLITQADLFRINYYGTSGAFQEISVSDIIDRKYPPSFFAGKIVLIGITAAGIEEKLLTPFTQKRSNFSSVELYAHILNNISDKNDIRELPMLIRWMLALAYSVLFLLIFLRLNEKASAFLCLFALAFGVMSVFVLFSFFCIWLSPAMMLLLVVLMFLMSYLVKFDIAAARLDDAYLSVISHLKLSYNEMTNRASRRGFLSKGVIDSRLEVMTQITDRLIALDRLKSMFIASMSHELRTPLNSIIGFTGMTLQGLSGELNDEQKDNLARVYQSAKHLLALISDVIDISKIEAGRVDSFPEEISLRNIIDEAIDTVEPQLKEKRLTLAVDVHKDVKLNTDRKRLLQCLINFLSNGVKFTEKGGITISSRERNADVEISVTDTGIGIAEKDMPKLFEAFERLDTHLRVKAGGTGLGLYLTKKLATDILQGSVSVQSMEGQGSTFTLRVPRDLHQTSDSTKMGDNR